MENNIPKIFHFTYKNEKELNNHYINLIEPKGETRSLRWCVDTFIHKNPDWKYIFWSDNDIINFINDKYHNFLNIWLSLKTIERIDIFRYMCLYENGGLFLDTDCICVRPLTEFINLFCINSHIIVGQEMEKISNWIYYPPHIQLNLWSIFSTAKNFHLRNILSLVIGNCICYPTMPTIEKTSMAAFGDYIYKASKSDNTIQIVSTSFLSLDGRFQYMYGNSFGIKDCLPTYILHGYHGSWIDDDFRKYSETMNQRDFLLHNQT